MLEFKHVSKSYQQHIIFKDLNFSFSDTGLIMILGESGSGKTTIFNLIALLDMPDSGHIFYDYQDLTTFSKQKCCEYRKYSCSILYQKYHLIEHLNVFDNIMLPLVIQNRKIDIQPVLALLKIEDKVTRYPSLLSGGEQQRVALARAIVKGSPLLLADEPTGALDSKNAKIVMEILQKEAQTKLVLVVTHNSRLAAEYGDDIFLLHDGTLEKIRGKTTKNKNKQVKKENKSNKIISWKNLTTLTIKSFIKRKNKYIASIGCYSLCLALMLVVMGLKSGLNSYCDELIVRRGDYSYINLYGVEDGVLSSIDNSIMNQLDQYTNTIVIRPSLDYIFNNYLSFPTASNNYYEVKIIDGIEKAYMNEMFYEFFKIDSKTISLSGYLDVPYLLDRQKEYIYVTYKFELGGVYNEGRLYNVAKLYLPRKQVEEKMQTTSLPLLSKKLNRSELNLYEYINEYDNITIYSPMEIQILNNNQKDEIYTTLLDCESVYQKYSQANLSGKYVIVESGDEMLRTTFKELIESGQLVILLFLLSLILSIVSLISLLIVFSLKEREQEFGIIRSFGGSMKDVIKLIILEGMIFGLISYAIGIMLSCVIRGGVYEWGKFILKEQDKMDLVLLQCSDYFYTFCVVFLVFILSTISPIYKGKKLKIIEVIKDD